MTGVICRFPHCGEAIGMPTARVVPRLYAGAAYASLALACLMVAWSPQAVAGFFYHSWMLAIVHLVTLGWITSSILSAVYLGLRPDARRGDAVAFGFVIVGLVGMVAHFGIQEFGGMAWSAATATCGILYVAARCASAARRSNAPAATKLLLTFGCTNIVVAAAMGILIAFDKVHHFMPGFVLSNVFAHAHLAAIGWAAFMLIGFSYWLLPLPSSRWATASAVLIEAGVLLLFIALLLQSPIARIGGAAVAVALSVFIAQAAQAALADLARVRRGAPIDIAMLHLASALVCIVTAIGIGLALLFLPTSERTLRAAAAYGVLGLLGFVAQLVVVLDARLTPARSRDRTMQAITFAAWTVAVPSLAVGLGIESARWLAVGAWSLAAGVGVGALQIAFAAVGPHFSAQGVSDVRTCSSLLGRGLRDALRGGHRPRAVPLGRQS